MSAGPTGGAAPSGGAAPTGGAAPPGEAGPTGGPRSTAFARALEQLGRAIVDGELPAGHIDTVEGFVERTGASRSVVREVTRVLGTLGMLCAGRRIGLRVLPREHWDVLDPHVIRWRMAGPEEDAAAAADELRALRHAIEPAAAAAAARTVGDLGAQDERAGVERSGGERAADEQAGESRGRSLAALESAGRALADVPPGAEAESFLEVDRAVHAAILELSGNSVFMRLGAVIDEGLRTRAVHDRAGLPPDPHDLDLHRRVVGAILAGDPEDAASAMRQIVERTALGLRRAWQSAESPSRMSGAAATMRTSRPRSVIRDP